MGVQIKCDNKAGVASVPGLPRFDLPFAFTTIHGIEDRRKLKWASALVH